MAAQPFDGARHDQYVRLFNEGIHWFVSIYCFVGVSAIALVSCLGARGAGGASALVTIGVLTVVWGAFGATGWLMGLIFGIPRSLSRPLTSAADMAGDPSGRGGYRANTNLEDVSDWLTKTLIGVGLTQAVTIKDRLVELSVWIGSTGLGLDALGSVFALCLIIYAFVGCFWVSYIYTRTRIPLLFRLFDTEVLSAEGVTLAASPANLGLEAQDGGIAVSPARNDPKLQEADRTLMATPLASISTPDHLAAWAGAHARAGNLHQAVRAFERAVELAPGRGDLKEMLARIYAGLGWKEALSRLAKDVPLSEIQVLGALYQEPPTGFTRAIELGSQIAATRDVKPGPLLHVWMACAYGQAHAYYSAHPLEDAAQSQERIDDMRAKAIAEVRAALQVDPNNKALLASLWKPKAGSSENDLASIPADDPELSRLLD